MTTLLANGVALMSAFRDVDILPETTELDLPMADGVRANPTQNKEFRLRKLRDMKHGRSTWSGGRKTPTPTMNYLNQRLWDGQDWETIELMDDTRKIWAHEWFDGSQFEWVGYAKPFTRQPLIRQNLYGNAFNK